MLTADIHVCRCHGDSLQLSRYAILLPEAHMLSAVLPQVLGNTDAFGWIQQYKMV